MDWVMIMATKFRKYWTAVICRDRVVMKHIQNNWIGVQLLSGKHKCVENCLTGMETEYKRISNATLQEICMNISCRYHEGYDRRVNSFPQHPLDEVQEDVNFWTKRILLGPDELSWEVHIPSVVCAYMCFNFEESEYVKINLDYTDTNEAKLKAINRTSNIVEPSKLMEREGLYKWCIIMFNNEIPNRECIVVDGYTIMKELKCKLKWAVKETKLDKLEDFITSIFGSAYCTDTNNEVNDGKTVEVIHDYYNYSLQAVLDAGDGINSRDINTHNVSTRSTTVTKLGLSNIFNLGHEKMVEMKIPAVRKQKQNRMKRSQAFFVGT